jgi:nicotinamidase-related amidase
MSPMTPDRSALVLVDYQHRLMPIIDGAARVVDDAVFLADVARELAVPVVGTAQNPPRLGDNVAAVHERCGHIVAKTHFDACRDGLVELLREVRPGLAQVVIGGCEAHVCLLQTALGLRRAGLETFVVADACGSRSPADRALALQRLAQAGVVIASAEMVAFEWLDDCRHPQFRAVLERIKRRAAAP